MSNTPKQDEFADDLALVSDVYRKTATETTPDWIDSAVLRTASTDVRRPAIAQRFASWVRPMAFVATAGLCLALVLEFGQIAEIDDRATTSDYAGSGADALSSAVEASGRRLQDLNRTADSIRPSNLVRYCTEQQSADPDNWWRCIEALRSTGRTADAQSELDLLRSRFPEFEPPG